jgi:hypothetical protein
MNYRCTRRARALSRQVKIVCTLFTFIVLTGCQKSVKHENLAIDPMAQKVSVPPQFAYASIDKAGGLEAWGRVREIQLDCIVAVYDKDAGYYLTEQKYEIFPWSDSIVISGKESQASYEWQLKQGKFDVLKGTGQINSLKNQIDDICFAEAILNLVAAPAKFLDKSVIYSRDTNAVNIQGRWCYPITSSLSADGESSLSAGDTVFYQNRVSSLVDTILLTCGSNNAFFLVCGYDYRPIQEGEISIPSRIEIYTAGKEGESQRQLFRIDITSAGQK